MDIDLQPWDSPKSTPATCSVLIHATTVDEAIDPKNAMLGKIGTAI